MAVGASTLWRLRPRSTFEHRNWAGESVLYVHITAETHRLNLPTSTVLLTMLDHPDEALSDRQWLQRLMGDGVSVPAETLTEELAVVQTALDSLRQLVIVEMLTP